MEPPELAGRNRLPTGGSDPATFKMAGEWRQISGSQFCDICRQENRRHTGAAALLGKDVAGFILN